MSKRPETTHETGAVATGSVFARPKHGHAAAEYEDAYAVAGVEAFPVRAAVADGATETAFSRRWAQILTVGWVEEGPADASAFAERLPAWQQQWHAEVTTQAQQQAWYAAAKAEEGAYAAVLGLTLRANGMWQALSVGDCALFHLRGRSVETVWPFDDPEDFTRRPALVASRADASSASPVITAGTWTVGDAFVLASDALAAWLLRTDPAAALDWEAAAFAARVRAARAAGTLQNDDVTLLRLVPHAR